MLQVQALKVELYDGLMEEKKEKVLFIKNSKIFEGALFSTFHEWNVIKNIMVSELLEAETEKELVDKSIQFYADNGRNSETLESTMKHWSYMNGFIDSVVMEYQKN